ncbi:MAG: hypothetical protein ACXADY_20615 [Candidatus Hodarchaeales archaeon]|jgi:hypothetical protein
MVLITKTKVILGAFSCLFALIFLLLLISLSMSNSPYADLSSELFFESPTSLSMIDLNYVLPGEFYYSSETNLYIKSYNPEDQSEINQFRLSTGFLVDKYAINPYSGDLYFVEENGNNIKVIYDYQNSYSDSPGSVLSSFLYLSHTTDIRDLATIPIYPDILLFSTDSNMIYYTYRDYYGNMQVEIFMNVPLAEIGGSWNGEFSVDNYGNFYFVRGTGKIYRYDLNNNDFSLFYSSTSNDISSICFDSENTLYYTSGDNRVFRLVSSNQTQIDFAIDDPIDIAIVFVGYDQDIINSSKISNKLPHYGSIFLGGDENAHYYYQANYSYYFADQAYIDELDAFVADHSVNDPTTQLDVPKLEYQAEFWDPQDVFLPKNGTAIDGNAVESWLVQNRYVIEADYCISVLNFSYFDSEAGDHWFEIKDIDLDSGIQKHWYRNEFDFPWNHDVEFPYVGYTGYESKDIFFDPTASQWYLKWIEIWNGLNVNDGDHDFYDEDLDHFMKTHDDPNDYISDWLVELVSVNLFWQPVNRIDFSNDISLQIKVFNGVSHLGFTNSDLEWTVNKTAIDFAFTELMPESNFSVDIEFLDLTNYSNIESILNHPDYNVNYSPDEPPIDNYTYYDGNGIYDHLFSRTYRKLFFDLDAADLVVTGFAFILDNATFAAPGIWSGGGLYTGLGGDLRILQLMELDRIFYPNRTESIAVPRQGLTHVLVHETGHAIGFPHTFTSTRYASDFTADTMGYYGDYSRFSRIRVESFQRYAAKQEIFAVQKMIHEHLLIDDEIEWLVDLQDTWDNITDNYYSKDYLTARQVAIELQQLLLEHTPTDTNTVEPPDTFTTLANYTGLLFTSVLILIAVFAVIAGGVCLYFFFIK